MRYTIIALLTLGISASSLEAQKRCVKGIPCGNTCIAANKTCRIGTPSGSASGTAQPAVAAFPVARVPRGDYRFIVYERADGRLLLQAVPERQHVAANSVLAFELSPDLSREDARQLAEQMTTKITGVIYTSSGGGSGTRRTNPVSANDRAVEKGEYFYEFNVTRQATPLPSNPQPEYPSALGDSPLEGTVVAQFIVSASGIPELRTLHISQSSHDLFTEAVRAVLPRLRYKPAESGQRRVRQQVRQTFTFRAPPR